MKRFLFVNPFGIGDVIFTLSVIEAVRAAVPDARIGFLCNERTAGLVRMDTSIDRTFVFHRDRYRRLWRKNPFLVWRKLRGFLKLIQEERYEILFDYSLGRQYSFFATLVGIPKRAGFDYKKRGVFLTHKLPLKGYERSVAEIQLSVPALVGIQCVERPLRPALRIPESESKEAEIFLRKSGIVPADEILAIAPGGGRSWGPNAIYKQWDVDRFAAVANWATRRHSLKILFLGDREEWPLLDKTSRLVGGAKISVCGETLPRVAALLLRSKALVCNDGGLLHMANALGVKTVSIFGPVDERIYGPVRNGTAHAVLIENVSCRPCYRDFRFPPCLYERRCLTNLAVQKVTDSLERILA